LYRTWEKNEDGLVERLLTFKANNKEIKEFKTLWESHSVLNDLEITYESGNKIKYEFRTRYDPYVQLIVLMAEMFPKASLDYDYDSIESYYFGHFVVEKGVVIKDGFKEYGAEIYGQEKNKKEDQNGI